MPTATLTVTLPEDVWVGAVSRAHPEATVRVLAALPGEETGVGMAEVVGPDPDAVVEAMADAEGVTSLRRLGRAGDRVHLQFETTEHLLLRSLQAAGVPLELPVEVRDGTVEVAVTAPRPELSELATQLDRFGLDYEVRAVERAVDPERLLTERQREVLRAAVEAGYYDTPRATSLTALADDLGVAKSSLSETLHRAEGKVVGEFVAETAAPDEGW